MTSRIEINKNDSVDVKDEKSFQARLFGMFYEKLLEPWFERHEYRNLGRPSTYDNRGKWTRSTYDLYLEKGGNGYVVEAKSYPAYLDGTWKMLTASLLGAPKNWSPRSFASFLETDFILKWNFKVNGKDVHPRGKILIWWDYDVSDLANLKGEYAFSEVFSVRKIIGDLKELQDSKYLSIVNRHRKFAIGLFDLLSN